MAKLNEGAIKLLTEGKNIATIVTLMPDGSPQASVVWIDSDGENVVFNTAEGRLKTNNMRRDPRVAIVVTHADNAFQQLTVRGRVVEITTEGADDHIDTLAKKYLGLDSYPNRTPGEQRLIIRIAPERVGGMG
ncbi:MAG: PPOX class F420-dependent oxidoreductase [Chloroflexi bacterium]|nr:PPOX class F420-dependent oxidoreductase [Chloroflexota bacterium]